jgi:hypothetical protein
MDVARFRAEGWPLMDDFDVEAPWLEWQPSAIQVLIHQTERATSLPELKTPGQKVDALHWTRSQRSAFWPLWRARRHTVREDTDRCIVRVRNAVAKIPQAGPQLPCLGTRLFAFAQREPMFSSEAGWALWCIREPAPRMCTI